MTAFDYVTGNPDNLVSGDSASMADIQGPFVDIKTKLNDGTLDETNVPNLAAAFTTYKPILWGGTTQVGWNIGTFLLNTGPTAVATSALAAVGGASSAALTSYLDPADYLANARLTKLRVRSVLITNAVAPPGTITVGLYPVATWGGASGAAPTAATLGTVLSGSTVAVTTPAANTRTVGTSGDFTFPAAGHYVFGIAFTASIAATAGITVQIQLQMRQA